VKPMEGFARSPRVEDAAQISETPSTCGNRGPAIRYRLSGYLLVTPSSRVLSFKLPSYILLTVTGIIAN
jgi:hypothetical protein